MPLQDYIEFNKAAPKMSTKRTGKSKLMKNKSIAINAVLKILLTIVNLAVPLISGPYLARVLDVEFYGYYNQAVSLMAWFIPFATFGVYNYAIREISGIRNNKNRVSILYSQFFIIGVICTAITSVVYFIVVHSFIDPRIAPIYYFMSIELFAQMFYVEWVNEAFENYSFILVKTLVVKVAYILSIFVFVKKENDIIPFTIIAAGSIFLNYFLSFIYSKTKIKFSHIKWTSIIALIKPLGVMLLLANANLLYTYLDRLFLVIGSTTPIFSSYYQFSLAIVTIITQIINSIIIVTIPRLSHYLSNKHRDAYGKLLKDSLHLYLLFGFPLCIGMAVLSNEGIFLYGGEKYLAAGLTLRLFSIRTILCLFDRIFATQILFVNGQEKKITKLYFICGGINLVLDFTIFALGMLTPTNLVLTTIISEIILVILQFKSLDNLDTINREAFDWRMVLYFVLSLGFIPIYIIVKNAFDIQYTLSMKLVLLIIIVVFALCIVYYFLALALTKDPYFRMLINRVKARGKTK